MRTLEVSVDVKRVRRAYDRAYQDLAKRVPVRGFRPGQDAALGAREALRRADRRADRAEPRGRDARRRRSSRRASSRSPSPRSRRRRRRSDAEFVYTARVEIKPAFELPELTGLPARRPRVDAGRGGRRARARGAAPAPGGADRGAAGDAPRRPATRSRSISSDASTASPSRAAAGRASSSSSARSASCRASRSSSRAPAPARTARFACASPTTTRRASWPGARRVFAVHVADDPTPRGAGARRRAGQGSRRIRFARGPAHARSRRSRRPRASAPRRRSCTARCSTR